ncbi:MAG: type VI secretion system baseplate subunit TssG [Paracoccaceae bacterium]
MATGKGSGPDYLSLFEALSDKPEEHHVFQALRIIEAHFAENPRLGESRRSRQDAVRLAQIPEMAFPPSTLSDFTQGKDGQPARLTNRFFGFFGPHGPMPLHLTEFARDRLRNFRDPTFVEFANMFTHRFMSLLYRAWAAAEPAPNFDRGDDPLARKVASLAGYNGKELQNRDAMPDLTRNSFAGLLSQGPKNADGLVAILSTFFGVPVRIQQFVGCWLQLEPDDQWVMGRPAALGQSTSVGDRVWSRASKFRIFVGPLELDDYKRLLPGEESLDRFQAIVRTYAGDTLEWDINLILAGDSVPRASLGKTVKLGHVSWIGTRPDPDDVRPDAEDLYLYPQLGTQTHAA